MVTYCYYCLFILLWKLLVFNFAVMPEPFTLEWIRSVFTTLIWLSWNPSNLCTTCLELLQNVLMWFIFVLSLHLLPYARHRWGGWLDPHYLHELIWLICFSGRFVSTVCVLLATSCFAHIRACFLVILLAFLVAVSSLFIFICMLSSFIPWINCPLTHLSSSW